MKMKTITLIIGFLFGYQGAVGQTQEDVRLWKDVEPGIYEVGYEVLHEYDYGRTFKPKYDYYGGLATEEIARPVQISIWYPATSTTHSATMQFREYVHATITETAFHTVQESEKTRVERTYQSGPLSQGGNPAYLQDLFAQHVLATKNAARHPGKFPLILYASSHNSSPYENRVLLELLASRGYVVAAIPSTGQASARMTQDIFGIEAQVRDLEFALATMREYPSVDYTRIGVAGFSLGGLSAPLLALKNANIDAVASLDGSIAFADWLSIVEADPYFEGKRMRAAFLHLLSRRLEGDSPHNTSFFDDVTFADACLYQLKALRHPDFASSIIRMWAFSQPNNTRLDKAGIEAGYATMIQYVLMFFDAYLKREPEVRQFLQTNQQDGITLESFNRAQIPAPNEAQLVDIIREKGVQTGIALIQRFRMAQAEHPLFSETLMNRLGYDALSGNSKEEAILLFRLNVQAYPNSSNVYDSLGDAYYQSGDFENALANFEKSLALDPSNQNAKRMIAQIKSGGDT